MIWFGGVDGNTAAVYETHPRCLMKNLREVSKHFLSLVAGEDRKMGVNEAYRKGTSSSRTDFFWLADNFGRQLGLDRYEVDEIVRFLSSHDLLHWRHHHTRTVELTAKGLNWEFHQSLFDPEPQPVHYSPVLIKEAILGDKFENIHHSTIYNHSTFTDAFNVVKAKSNDDIAEALEKVAEAVGKSGNEEAGELFDAFNEEVKREKPRKSVLKRTWDSIVAVIPAIASMVGVAEKIAKLFA